MEDLVTERLRLRSPRPGDAEFIARLMNSSGYMQNIGDRGVRTAKDATDYLASAPIYARENDLGFNIVEIASTGEPVGICGLVKRETYCHPDLGYAFVDERSGCGFASEAAGRVVRHAFDDLRLPELLAITSRANGGSRRVLEKLGFELSSSTEGVALYRLLPPD